MDTRDTLLLACGTSESRKNLRDIFEDDFNILEADTSEQTMLFAEQNYNCIAAVILDITVRTKINRSILSGIGKLSELRTLPVVVLTDTDAPEAKRQMFERGVTDVYPSDIDPFLLKMRMHNIVELFRHKWHLEDRVEEQADILRRSNDTMVDALSSIIEYRSVESGQHILRIRRYTKILLEEIARNCPEYGLDDKTIGIISSASALHDIGKISIPDAILNKPGKLTEEEFELMKTHTVLGCRMLENLTDVGNEDYLRYAHNIAHYHHERWDGKGYPEGIKGDEIPICAQVVGLADAYDALTNKRVYKEAFSCQRAVNMIVNGNCGVFSPKVIECFKHSTKKFKETAKKYSDGASPKSENFNMNLPVHNHGENQNTLHTVEAKYRALMHYVNAAVIEIDFDMAICHLMYNPDPNLDFLYHKVHDADIAKSIIGTSGGSDRDAFRKIIEEDIPRLFKEGQARQKHYINVKDRLTGNDIRYELTVLRIAPGNHESHRVLIIWKMADDNALITRKGNEYLRQDTSFDYMIENFRCKNDFNFTLVSGNDHVSRFTGYTTNDLMSEFNGRLIELVVPREREFVRNKIKSQLDMGRDIEVTYRLITKSGNIIWVLHKGFLEIDEDGYEYLNNIIIDITHVKNAQNEYNFTVEQYERILSQTGNIVFELDPANDIIEFSDAFEDVFGYKPILKNIMTDLSTHSHFHPDDIPKVYDWFYSLRACIPVMPIEVRIAKADGRYLWCRMRGASSFNAELNAYRILGSIVNIDEEKQITENLQKRAEEDSLTHLYNKSAARSRIEEIVEHNPNDKNALMIIDLDNFKSINDIYGHMFGDAVLIKVANAIKELFRSKDVVARIGGDEFLVFMKDVDDRNIIKNRAEKIIETLPTLFSDLEEAHRPRCSIGIAVSPESGQSYFELFQHADQALCYLKSTEKGRAFFYNPGDEELKKGVVMKNTRIDSEKEPGLADNSIVLHCMQKIYRAKNTREAINDAIGIVGRKMNVSRVYIFENSRDNLTCSNTFEWCNEGIRPEKDFLQNLNYEKDIFGYHECFNEEGIFYCPDINNLPRHLQDILMPQRVKSLLQCAFVDGGKIWGFIGFDECVNMRFWTKEQIETLKLFSEMLSVVLMKNRAVEITESIAKEAVEILDDHTKSIYIVDPVSFKLRYLNNATKKELPNAKEGEFCFKAIRGKTRRCVNCPIKSLGLKESVTQSLTDRKGKKIVVQARKITWGGIKSCIIEKL